MTFYFWRNFLYRVDLSVFLISNYKISCMIVRHPYKLFLFQYYYFVFICE